MREGGARSVRPWLDPPVIEDHSPLDNCWPSAIMTTLYSGLVRAFLSASTNGCAIRLSRYARNVRNARNATQRTTIASYACHGLATATRVAQVSELWPLCVWSNNDRFSRVISVFTNCRHLRLNPCYTCQTVHRVSYRRGLMRDVTLCSKRIILAVKGYRHFPTRTFSPRTFSLGHYPRPFSKA